MDARNNVRDVNSTCGGPRSAHGPVHIVQFDPSVQEVAFRWPIVSKTTAMSFKYGLSGKRIEKISPSATSIFVYDGDDLIETVNSSGGVVARYTQGQDIDEPLALLRGCAPQKFGTVGIHDCKST